MEVQMNKTKTQGATIEAARHMLLKSERDQQAAQNEQEFVMFAMNFFRNTPLPEAVENAQLDTVRELSVFLETYDENDPEFVPDEIMKITMRGQDVVSFLIQYARTYDQNLKTTNQWRQRHFSRTISKSLMIAREFAELLRSKYEPSEDSSAIVFVPEIPDGPL